MSTRIELNHGLRDWIVEQVKAGQPPEAVLKPLLEGGWPEQAAIDAVEETMHAYLADHARQTGLPLPTRVPVPIEWNGASVLQAEDRPVQVLAHLMQPQIIVFGNFLSEAECDGLVSMARTRMTRSFTLNLDTGVDEVHSARTSEGMFFQRGENDLCARIEARIAALTGWPAENGEALQVLRYGPGAEYKPHHDYFDPDKPGTGAILNRGGQRVASFLMYLNSPACGGATTFPEVNFEVAPIKGNALFFSYDRPHPVTRTLHGGAPVLQGEKWVATKWLRQHRHD